MNNYDSFRMMRKLRPQSFCALMLAAVMCLALFYALREAEASQAPAPLYKQIARLKATFGAPGKDHLGDAVAIDGETVVAGAPQLAARRGMAYVFERLGQSFSLREPLVNNDGRPGDLFGHSVAVKGDTAIVGAPGSDSGKGAVYVFERRGERWEQQQKLVLPDSLQLGFAVALDGDTLVVGAPGTLIARGNEGIVAIFKRANGVWEISRRLLSPQSALGGNFGHTVAVSGARLIVGEAQKRNSFVDHGAAYVYAGSGSDWRLEQELVPPVLPGADYYGRAVTISGGLAVVGAQRTKVGSNSAQGVIHIFALTNSGWAPLPVLAAQVGQAGDEFGHAVAVDGDRLVVGAPRGSDRRGLFYLFERSGVTAWTQRLTTRDSTPGYLLGTAVAIDNDTFVVGRPGDDSEIGSALVFDSAANDPPRINAFPATLSSGHNGKTLTIAKFSDAEDAENTMRFTVNGGESATIGGVTVSDIRVFDNGYAQARISTACGAVSARFTLRVTDSQGDVAQAFLRVDVTADSPPLLSYETPPPVNLGGALSFIPEEVGDEGKLASVALRSVTPAFSGAISVDNQTGRVSINNAAPAGRFTVTVRATDECGTFKDASFTLNVTALCPAVTINPASLPGGTTGAVYNQTLTATGGVAAPFTFSLSDGELPKGLSLAANGRLSGTPTGSGDFSFTVKATDANGCPGARSYKLAVKPVDCSYQVSQNNFVFTSAGGQGTISVSTNNGCAWAAESKDEWITIKSGGGGSGSGNVTFTVAKNAEGAARTGALSVAGLKVTIAQSSPVTCVSAASFAGTSLASESIVSAFGQGLAKTTEVAKTLPLPTTLAGTRVSLRDSAGQERFAPLFFISPGQINFQVPPGVATGKAMVTVLNDKEMVAASEAQIEPVAPALFSADASGQGVMMGVALRVRADGSQSFEPVARFDEEKKQFVAVPINPGPASDRVFLILFATGLRNRSSLNGVSVKIGGVSADALFAGPQGSFTGLDQLNVSLPRNLAGRGEADLIVMVDGKQSNTLKLAIN